MSAVFALAEVGLAEAIEREHQAATRAARASIEHAIRCGELLLQAKALVAHGEWLPWIKSNLSFGPRQAQKYCRLAEHDDLLQMRTPGSHLSINDALAALADPHPKSLSTGNEEWHTPARYVQLVCDVLVKIDLDPASNDIANRTVGATRWFTREDNALDKEWHGPSVFMNPPYSRGVISRFVDKLLEERHADRVEQAIVLTHNFCDARWWHKLVHASEAVCFTNRRIRFESPTGDHSQPTQGQTFFYLGIHLDRFREVFSQIGSIMLPARVP
jgi:phage N-6-adenine-methyltransferase